MTARRSCALWRGQRTRPPGRLLLLMVIYVPPFVAFIGRTGRLAPGYRIQVRHRHGHGPMRQQPSADSARAACRDENAAAQDLRKLSSGTRTLHRTPRSNSPTPSSRSSTHWWRATSRSRWPTPSRAQREPSSHGNVSVTYVNSDWPAQYRHHQYADGFDDPGAADPAIDRMVRPHPPWILALIAVCVLGLAGCVAGPAAIGLAACQRTGSRSTFAATAAPSAERRRL